MKAEFETHISEKDLFDFNIFQIYTHSQGIISIIVCILAVVVGIYTLTTGDIIYGVLYILAGIIFVVYVPVSLKLRVKKTYNTVEAFSKPLRYIITEDSIKVEQNGEEDKVLWEQVYKVVANNKRVLIYTGRTNACIIPMEQIGDQYQPFLEIAKAKLEDYRLKIK